jgi:hypothetical protein
MQKKQLTWHAAKDFFNLGQEAILSFEFLHFRGVVEQHYVLAG